MYSSLSNQFSIGRSKRMSYVVCRWALDEEEKFRILPFSNATFVRSRNQLRNNIEKENENEKKKVESM